MRQVGLELATPCRPREWRLSAHRIREQSDLLSRIQVQPSATSAKYEQDMNTSQVPPGDAMEFETGIWGAGPAGLAAAIRIKQLAPEKSVVIVEKGSEVGAHILSGAVIDPVGLDRLIPEWRTEDTPIKTAVTAD